MQISARKFSRFPYLIFRIQPDERACKWEGAEGPQQGQVPQPLD